MELFFRKFGESQNPKFLILHGLYGMSDNWVSIARKLSEKYEVFLIDQRNHGHSDHSEIHTYDAMVDDLLEFFKNHHIGNAHLLGHSMGGKTAMLFAKKYPHFLNSLMIADIAPKNYTANPGTDTNILRHKAILKAMHLVDFSKVERRGDIENQLEAWIKSKPIRQFILKNVNKTETGYSWMINTNALEGNLRHLIAGVSEKELKEIDSDFTSPVLFLKGANSNYIQSTDYPIIAELFPTAQIVSLPNAGHWLHAEQPSLLLKNIEFFLQ